MSQRRSLLSSFAIYIVVVGALLVCLGVGFAVVVKTSAGLPQRAAREKTLLDLRIENSREIRDALAKPVARPEPLLPIAAKLEHPLQSKVAVKTWRPRSRPAKDARDAFESSDFFPPLPAMALDRHAPQ